jgi:hypothetical protein
MLKDGTPIFTNAVEDFARMLAMFSGASSRLEKLGGNEPASNVAHFIDAGREGGVIVEVKAPHCELVGRLRFDMAPRNLVTLDLTANKLRGPLDLTNLPITLRHLCLAQNEFSGPVDMTALPNRLETLNISVNQLTGTLDLGRLPPKLKKLHAFRNLFEYVTTLPSTSTAMAESGPLPDLSPSTSAGEAAVERDVELEMAASAPVVFLAGGAGAAPPDPNWALLPATLKVINVEGNPLKQRKPTTNGLRNGVSWFW